MKTCRKCGETKPLEAYHRHRQTRDGLRHECRECRARELAEWRKTSVAHQEYESRNAERKQAYLREYYREHQESMKARARERSRTRPAEVAATKRRYYEANKDSIAQKQRAYYEAHREDFFERAARRRALKRQALSEAVSHRTVFERDGGKCGICGQQVDPGHWHLDHVVPLSLGGSHTYDNVQVSHPLCNLRKGATLPEEVM